jgi:hypothetical protein
MRIMVYALCCPWRNIPAVTVRRTIASAIVRNQQASIDSYVDEGWILHVPDWRVDDECFCVWCGDDVTRSEREGRTFFKHINNNACIGHDDACGVLNPPDQGYS